MGQNQTKEYYQTSIIPGTTVGYLSYLPPAYQSSSEQFPLMIFLHGLGEIGSNLDDLLHYGPPMLIRYNKWPSDRPFIVVSPQSPSAFGGSWNPALVDEVIDQAVARYRVDRSRIYVTGTSLGGNGAWKYATEYPERVAAVVPICGWGTPNRACEMKDVPVWAFHNQGDNVVGVSGTINMIDALEKCGPNPWPKEVIYPESGHNAWSKTYDLSSGHDIYSWMLSFRKGSVSKPAPAPNKAPVANAGADKHITLPTSSTVVSGTGSDADGTISSYAWAKTGGPTVTMTNSNTKSLSLSNLVEGTYYFKLTVKDNLGAIGTDIVQVIVKKQEEAPAPVTGQGLNYAYYEGNWSSVPNFSGLSPKKTGTVANFSLSNKNRADYYAFEFTGSIEILTAGTYTFYTSSDDGSKLYINSKEVVNNDGLHGVKEKSGAVYLSAGKHPISVGYFEDKGGDALNVMYSGPGVSKQTIPNARLYTSGSTSAPAPAPAPGEGTAGLSYSYYEGDWSSIPNFSGLAAKKQGSVSNFILNVRSRADYYAVEYQGYIEILTAGDYNFYTSSDDGSKLYINGKEIVNNDGLHGKKEVSGKVYLNTGKHPIKVSYFESKGDDILLVQYSGPGVTKQTIPNGRLSTGGSSSDAGNTTTTNPVNGIQYHYYEGNWSNIPNYGALAAKKSGTLKNFSLSPAPAISYYGFQFDGQIKINTAGDYTFYTSSDDGSKLYINGKEIVNNDGLHGKRESSGRINLTAGYHDIKVTFFESKGDNILEVRYAGPGIGKQIIPDGVLFLPSSMTQSATADLKESSFAKASEEELESPVINVSKAYPNPFSEEINVEIAANDYEGAIQISLLDLSGKVVYNKVLGAHEANGTINIPTSNLNVATGMYFLQIIKGKQKEVFKLIKK